MLTHLEQLLALHLGPIARVIVKRAAKGAATPEQLYAALAAEIPSEADRKRFLSDIKR